MVSDIALKAARCVMIKNEYTGQKEIDIKRYAKVTYSRIGLLRRYRNLQSYWTTTMLCKATVVFQYYNAMETYGRIGLLQ